MRKITTNPEFVEIDHGSGQFIEAALTYKGNVRINVNGERITLDRDEIENLAHFLIGLVGEPPRRHAWEVER